jgi:hypothetical protein
MVLVTCITELLQMRRAEIGYQKGAMRLFLTTDFVISPAESYVPQIQRKRL